MEKVELWSSGPGWFGFGSLQLIGEAEINTKGLKAGDTVKVNGVDYTVAVTLLPTPKKISLLRDV